MSTDTDKTKQEADKAVIVAAMIANKHFTISEAEAFLNKFINQQVNLALEEVKSKKTSYRTEVPNEYGIKIQLEIANAVPLSAIEQIQERFKK